MRRVLSRFADCVWIVFLMSAVAAGAILFAHLSKDVSRAGIIFWLQ